jgi:hypothetical protein
VGRAAIGPTAFPYFVGLARDNDFIVLLPTILGGALALAIIASIDALLCAKLVTAPGEPRRDGDWLLMRLGVGNLAAASIGGITSGINIGIGQVTDFRREPFKSRASIAPREVAVPSRQRRIVRVERSVA